MSYFSPKFVDFFKGLAANNNKEYFDANRKTYIKEVKNPFQALLMDVRDQIAKSDPEVKKQELKNAVFRINRDIRFSKDKTPYNLHVSAVVSPYLASAKRDTILFCVSGDLLYRIAIAPICRYRWQFHF